MTDTPADPEEWIDIDEAVRRTGLSKRTLNRHKAAKSVETQVIEAEFRQRQRRTLFKVSTLPLAKS
jgi:hypothetical protein